MNSKYFRKLISAAILAVIPYAVAHAQNGPLAVPESPTPAQLATQPKGIFDRAQESENNWYFSWGYSRQQYAASDIHVTQPSQGNNFTVHQASGGDYPATFQQTIDSITSLDITTPQENMRIGKFMNPEKTFAIEFSVDHSKYNTDTNQQALVTGTVAGQPYNQVTTLDKSTFDYELHNGLNHLMINAVWLTHLAGLEQKPGHLQMITRVGAGILLPHAQNTIFGKDNDVGPKNQNVCCFSKGDWWQVNGWTAGFEFGVRYTVYKTMFIELTDKMAYGVLRGVPVYQGSADQDLWMNEQVLSTGFLF